MTWHPARGEETSQELNIRFMAEGEGTRVEIVHSGWDARRVPTSASAWPATTKAGSVLADFAAAAGRES